MVRRRYLFLLLAVLTGLSAVLLWRLPARGGRPALSREAQAGVIRQMAEQPSSWRGWELLHTPDPAWTDPHRSEQSVRPVPQPLSPAEPFFVVDSSRNLTPQEAAKEALHGMLHYIKANRAGQGYELLDFRVAEPRLLGREEILQRALAHCGTPALNKRTEEQLRAWCRGFFRRYPGLGENMWMVEPAFSLKWSGEIDSIPYELCVSSGMADEDGLVDLPAVFRSPARFSPLLLIRQGHQYRLQHAEAFFQEYEGGPTQGLPDGTERT